MDRFSPNQVAEYHVEHLATFSTTSAQHEYVTPRMALQRLFKMEKTSGIWYQRMAIQLKGNHMWILDGETNDVVERFPVAFIQQPTSFNDQNHIYNNILIFTVQLPNETQGELHIFQCVSHEAINVVDDIYNWMRQYGVASGPSDPGTTSGGGGGHRHHGGSSAEKSGAGQSHSSSGSGGAAPAVNVKEAVNAFNQIAAQREKKGASSDSIHRLPHASTGAGDTDSRCSDSSSNFEPPAAPPSNGAQSASGGGPRHSHSHDMHESYSNERYVSILNHCFDDIERFIIRLQHAAVALRELQLRNNKRGGAGNKAKGSGDGLLAIRARGPGEEEFFEILAKFKLAFNLLAKLKGCIHDPNAPELVHFLFTPLAIIIEAARANELPVDPSVVGIPYLSADATELLSNCCTSKEYDLWQSLGANWVQPVKHIRMSSPFQPVFTDGWAPAITEPELLGIVTGSGGGATATPGPPVDLDPAEEPDPRLVKRGPPPPPPPAEMAGAASHSRTSHANCLDDSDYEEQPHGNGSGAHYHGRGPGPRIGSSPSSVESIDRDSPTTTANGSSGAALDAEQLDWLAELQAHQSKIVRVLFPRTATNNKELTVTRGEILEILDDSRKWWKARNIRGQVAYVPHTIVGELEPSVMMAAGQHQQAGRGADPAASGGMTHNDWIRRERQVFQGSIRRARLSRSDSWAERDLFEQLDSVMAQAEQSLESGARVSTVSGEQLLARYQNETDQTFSSEDLAQYLTLKEFPPELVDCLVKLFDCHKIQCQMLAWSKQQLKKNLPKEIAANDSMLQRLSSNLLLLKNTIKSSKASTLAVRLNQRKRMLQENLDQEQEEKEDCDGGSEL